jgi:hypothetical protein
MVCLLGLLGMLIGMLLGMLLGLLKKKNLSGFASYQKTVKTQWEVLLYRRRRLLKEKENEAKRHTKNKRIAYRAFYFQRSDI